MWVAVCRNRRFNATAALYKASGRLRRRRRNVSTGEKLKITAGAISALVIVAWLAVLTIAFPAA
jgi:hypothetical protein